MWLWNVTGRARRGGVDPERGEGEERGEAGEDTDRPSRCLPTKPAATDFDGLTCWRRVQSAGRVPSLTDQGALLLEKGCANLIPFLNQSPVFGQEPGGSSAWTSARDPKSESVGSLAPGL